MVLIKPFPKTWKWFSSICMGNYCEIKSYPEQYTISYQAYTVRLRNCPLKPILPTFTPQGFDLKQS